MRGAVRRPAFVGVIALIVTTSLLAVGYAIAPNHESIYRNDVIGYSVTIPLAGINSTWLRRARWRMRSILSSPEPRSSPTLRLRGRTISRSRRMRR